MRAELASEIERLKARGVTPGLAVVLVGDNPASQVYVRMKGRACGEAGLHHETIRLPKQATEDTKRILNLHLQRAVLATIDFALTAEDRSFTSPELRANLDRLLSKGPA